MSKPKPGKQAKQREHVQSMKKAYRNIGCLGQGLVSSVHLAEPMLSHHVLCQISAPMSCNRSCIEDSDIFLLCRAQQRIRDGRPHAIDGLIANLHLAEEFDMNAEEPYKVFEGLSLQEVQDLHAAICVMQVGALQLWWL